MFKFVIHNLQSIMCFFFMQTSSPAYSERDRLIADQVRVACHL